MKSGQTVQYVRISSVGQNVARQINDTTIDKTFTDKCSGSTTDRPQLAAMLDFVRDGDTVVVHEISRLARNTADLLALVEKLNNKGVTVKFLKENMTFIRAELDANGKPAKQNAMNTMLLTIIGAISAFELSMINERRAEGQAKAKAEGKHCGRFAKLTADQVAMIRQRAANESKVDLAAEYGVSRATIYSVLKDAA
jgi:DNA invertase Pin-like site-specific DNA recombinase